MAGKKHYFVSVNTKDIREISIPDNQVEYEIIADEHDLLHIQQMFNTMEKESKNAIEDSHFRPFDEEKVEDERDTYEGSLMNVYRKLYELGTDQTKEKIEELGIIKR
ncbi:hypothetical protein [Oceanobacillus damuensis]|uniref:hypothetical protein n=1 Tax=Oceanobacillus damuensis TaxID=937928 RepID=UPI00082E37FB|nr:hypothetical protein [Oceanobacillus damuensis]